MEGFEARDAVLLLDKEKGRTSFSAIEEVRRLFGAGKAGHSGTIDKAATGLLVVCTGAVTRLTQYFLEGDKRYTGVIRLGVETDTCDAEGEVTAVGSIDGIDESRVRAITERFSGKISQMPPLYSALKIKGKRASDLVRQGRSVELAARNVVIRELNILEVDMGRGMLTVDVLCSKGTYIRSLARDIGEFLGTGAHLAELRRTASGHFSVSDAATIGEMREYLSGTRSDRRFLLTPEQALKDFGRMVVSATAVKRVSNGAFFARGDVMSMEGESPFIILDGHKNCIAIANVDTDNWSVVYRNVFSR
ncbi:MAG TPA: tRNA pseudouridine(55) synthase TruB [Spirochaetota bacterium]|nr:tRNA pseudouridine(55) synthase TruB [Spirochaetota bacterium]